MGTHSAYACLGDSETPERKLYDAAAKGDVKTLLDLLQKDGSLLNRVSFTCHNKTPLHVATICQHLPFVQQVVNQNPQLAEEVDLNQLTPLHIASARGSVDIVKELLSAAPNTCFSRDGNGRNPVHLAAIYGQLEVLNELIKMRPLAAREKVDRGQTVLHLCVKHQQLEAMKIILRVVNDYEFVNAKDDDGDTIVHLVVRCKQVETIQYLLRNTSLYLREKNAKGYKAFDILALTPKHLRDDNYLAIKHSLDQKYYPALNAHTRSWLAKSDAIMVVAVLIATMAFQAGVTPPGGVWQDNPSDNSHKAGEAVMAHNHPKAYKNFIWANTMAFILSLITIVLLLSTGRSFQRMMITWCLRVTMVLTVTSIAATYVVSIVVITPKKDRSALRRVVAIGLTVYGCVTTFLLVAKAVKLVNRWLRNPMIITAGRP